MQFETLGGEFPAQACECGRNMQPNKRNPAYGLPVTPRLHNIDRGIIAARG